MQLANLTSRTPITAPKTRVVFFQHDDKYVRVSLKLTEAGPDKMMLDAQAYEVDANDVLVDGPDARPSRTGSSQSMVIPSSLGDTHTLHPGWVRIVGDYNAETFDPTAPQTEGKPSGEPDWETNLNGQHYDTLTGIGYRWDKDGEVIRIARGKAEELLNIVRNSNPIAGIDF